MLLSGRDWKIPVVKKHHVWFAANTIIVTIIINSILTKLLTVKWNFWYFLAYLLIIIFMTKLISMLVFMATFSVIKWGEVYETKNPLGVDDFNLSSAAITTSFIINELFKFLKSVIVLVIIAVAIFYFTFWLNRKIRFP